MIYEILYTDKVSRLFKNQEETLIWSCLQGIMGKIYANDPNTPTAAMAIIGDFTFFAGEADKELVSYKPCWSTQSFMIMVPPDKLWLNLIKKVYGAKAKIISRYATKKEPYVFDKAKLEKAVNALPSQYTLSMIDERLYHLCKTETWSSDLVSQFSDYKQYRQFGIGAVICKDNLIISGASSYSRYRNGIEIEIDTREDYRRKGLAYICAAKLILQCLEQNLYPSWDAHNLASISLAQKLGYHYSHTYTAVEIRRLPALSKNDLKK